MKRVRSRGEGVMFSSAADIWMRLPLWTNWSAWGERDFIDGIAQTFVARVFYYGAMAASLAAGIWSGMATAARSGRNWHGWIVGVAIAVVIYGVIDRAGQALPGVDWRIKAMQNSDCYTDWDGRSNPVVCE